MSDRPRETDIQLNRERQLQEPYPAAALDQIVASNAYADRNAVPAEAEDTEAGGLKTGVPSNYEASLGGHPKSMTSFEVNQSPGRL